MSNSPLAFCFVTNFGSAHLPLLVFARRHDCGLYTIKYLQLWTGEENDEWGGLTMPPFTLAEMALFREELLWWLLTHPQNMHREEALRHGQVRVKQVAKKHSRKATRSSYNLRSS